MGRPLIRLRDNLSPPRKGRVVLEQHLPVGFPQRCLYYTHSPAGDLLLEGPAKRNNHRLPGFDDDDPRISQECEPGEQSFRGTRIDHDIAGTNPAALMLV